MSDLISIIVPVYNVKTEYFKNSINSILAQSYDNWECLLIDDGSTNGCGKICDEFESFDSRIKAIHTDNKGVSAARNRGLSEAKGNFIVFIDSDDTISSDYLKILYQMKLANKIGKEYYVEKENLIQFLKDFKGEEIVI